MSQLQPEDINEEDLANFSAINRSIKNQQAYNDQTIEHAKPIDRYMFQVRKALDKYKTGLADQTQVENMVAHITERYMRKYASNDSEAELNRNFESLLEKTQGTDIYQMMKDMEHRIAMELFNLRRVVDDGNFHQLLENNRLKTL